MTETALTTALNVSYMAENLALFALVVGVALLLAGIGFVILALAVFGRAPAEATAKASCATRGDGWRGSARPRREAADKVAPPPGARHTRGGASRLSAWYRRRQPPPPRGYAGRWTRDAHVFVTLRSACRGPREAFPFARARGRGPGGEVVAKRGRLRSRPPRITVKLDESHAHALAIEGAEPTGYGLGASGWVTVPVRAPGVSLDVLRDWIEESYRIVAPKGLVRRARPIPELSA